MTASNRWVFGFDDPLPDDVEWDALLGGKGASLRRMRQAGLDVPPGFTITTAACREYFHRQQNVPDGLWDEVRQALLRLESELGRQLGLPPNPLLLAVRSGATASMPGMMETLLDCGLTPRFVEGDAGEPYRQSFADYLQRLMVTSDEVQSDQDQADDERATGLQQLMDRYKTQTGDSFADEPWHVLKHAIVAVFESWNSKRTQQYRRFQGLDDEAGTAVTVQVMIPTDLAGVLFTRDPRATAENQMLIEAVEGRGDQLVSGAQTPSRWFVDRLSFEVVKRVEHAELDTEAFELTHLPSLCRAGIQLEDSFGYPFDIEWGIASGRLHFFQARAIPADYQLDELRLNEIERLKQQANERPCVWVRHNLAESLPAPTPLTWDVVSRFMSVDGAFGRLYRLLGFAPSQRLRQEGFLKLIAGRIYADPVLQAEMFCTGYPYRYDTDRLRTNPAELERPPSIFQPDESDPFLLWRLPRAMWIISRAARRIRRLTRTAADRFETQVLPPFLQYVDTQRERRLEVLSLSQLKELFDEYLRFNEEFGAESLLPGTLGAMAFGAVESKLRDVLGADAAANVIRTLMAEISDPLARRQQTLLSQAAHDGTALASLIDEFGHRGRNEMELAAPRWRECPDELQHIAGRSQPEKGRDTEVSPVTMSNEMSKIDLTKILADAGASCLAGEIDDSLNIARQLLPYRERGRHYLMMSWELIRRVAEEFGRRTALNQGIYYLTHGEIREIDESDLPQQLIVQRKRQWNAIHRLYVPQFIESTALDCIGRAPTPDPEHNAELMATPLTAGAAAGRISLSDEDAPSSQQSADRVHVCETLNPAGFSQFSRAVAIIVEQGGLLSHGTVIARQLGVPVVRLADATRLLRSGQQVLVDADLGRVLVEQQMP